MLQIHYPPTSQRVTTYGTFNLDQLLSQTSSSPSIQSKTKVQASSIKKQNPNNHQTIVALLKDWASINRYHIVCSTFQERTQIICKDKNSILMIANVSHNNVDFIFLSPTFNQFDIYPALKHSFPDIRFHTSILRLKKPDDEIPDNERFFSNFRNIVYSTCAVHHCKTRQTLESNQSLIHGTLTHNNNIVSKFFVNESGHSHILFFDFRYINDKHGFFSGLSHLGLNISYHPIKKLPTKESHISHLMYNSIIFLSECIKDLYFDFSDIMQPFITLNIYSDANLKHKTATIRIFQGSIEFNGPLKIHTHLNERFSVCGFTYIFTSKNDQYSFTKRL